MITLAFTLPNRYISMYFFIKDYEKEFGYGPLIKHVNAHMSYLKLYKEEYIFLKLKYGYDIAILKE